MDFDMGRYGFYVWSSYGAVALGLLGLVLATLIRHQTYKKQLAELVKAEALKTHP